MKKTWTKLFTALTLVTVTILTVIVSGCASGNSSDAKRYDNSINYFYADAEGRTHFMVNDVLLDDSIKGTVEAFISCDGSVGLARAGTGLFKIDGSDISKLYPAGVQRALLSQDNNTAVFTTATEVHIYDLRTGELNDVKPEGAASIPSIVISPSGNSVGFTVKDASGSFTAYAYEAGESRKLAENAFIAGISDGAKRFYYIRPDDAALMYVSGSSSREICKAVSSQIEFNRDLTEALFDIDGSTYYSINGSEAKPLIEGASVCSTNAECRSTQGGDICQIDVLDCATLFNCVFYSSLTSSSDGRTAYNLWYVDGGRHTTALVKGASQFRILDDKSRIACLVDGTVYLMNSKHPGDREQMAQNVYSFNVTPDGKSFYYIGVDLGLYYNQDSNEPKLIAPNAVYSLLTPEGKCLFISDFSDTGKLHLADGDSPVTDIAENVAHIEVMPHVCFYYSGMYNNGSHDVYDVFSSADGLSFEKSVAGAYMSNGD